MVVDKFAIRDLPASGDSAQEMARKLLYEMPPRGWTGYKGLDDALSNNIIIAEDSLRLNGEEIFLEEYGYMGAPRELKGLQAALRVLAKEGVKGLQAMDKMALGRGKKAIGALIQQSEFLAGVKKDDIRLAGLRDEHTWDSDELDKRRLSAIMNQPVETEREEY